MATVAQLSQRLADALNASRPNNSPDEPLPFFVGAYSEALSLAFRTESPLLVYLHSEIHDDSAEFVKGTLRTPELADALRSIGAVLWAGSAHEADGWEAAARLNVTAFPFAALLAPSQTRSRTGNAQYERFWSCSGLLDRDTFVAGVKAAGQHYRGVSGRVRAEVMAREQERRLVEEQEQAYEAAVARDLARAREAEERQRKEAEEARKAAEDKARAEEEAELQAAIDLSKDLDKLGMVDTCRARVAAAPEPGPGAGVATLRLQLPNGTKVQRRFLASDPLSLVRDFLVVTSADLTAAGAGTGAGKAGGGPVLGTDAPFDLASAFPKKTFDTHTAGSKDMGSTLQELGLVPQAALLVTLVAGK